MTLRNTRATKLSSEVSGKEADDVIEVPTSAMTTSGLFKGRTGLNLLLMIVLWVVSCFNYGMINIYMKYVPGTFYLNSTISGLSEIAAHVIVGVFYVKLTPRFTFFIGLCVAFVGSTCLIFQTKYEDNSALVAMFVLFTKFGISMSMCACYVSTPYVFPVVLSGTAFGICNTFGRFFGIAAPYMAEVDVPYPMEVFTAFTLAGLLVCLFINTDKEEPSRKSQTSTAKIQDPTSAD